MVIDDFGELTSGAHLKTLVYIFSGLSLVGILGTIGFYYLFGAASSENKVLKEKLTVLEKKADRLVNDKEILMARLVMSGKKPELTKASSPPGKAPGKDVRAGIIPKPGLEKKGGTSVIPENIPFEPIPTALNGKSVSESLPKKESKEPEHQKVVSVEKFLVLQGKTSEELVVKFNIRNIATNSKEISGRIFAVLKPGTNQEKDWVIAPRADLKDGIPTPYRKGQYFSISRFKPVRLTIKNQAAPDSFVKASIYIFGDKGKILFENTIKINGADKG
ncbi:MAG: hypothetical protein HUK40_18495 [Desulfobacter sp.]|nr:hypothetical protein [Desulfobacter sp.]WDP85926.1 MAG: hypothetical protein HUN05_12920 [Desulfobacter sp.]